MAEFNRDVWAPWRMQYIESLSERDAGGCFLCRHVATPQDDGKNHVLWRSPKSLVVLNRYPYNTGHLLVAPTEHRAELEDLSDEVLCEMVWRIRDATRVLQRTMHPQGFNIGMNLGRCAGAGVPDHLHWHIVPRWGGDTNFMPVIADVKVIPEALDRTYEKLLQAARELGL
ncbi:MAG: HIT domain-containing protein [Phycisphaerae bacterium]|nr:HIT domain-containing protein [Phycisphaerae bacterium]